MLYCKNCKSEIKDGATCCPNCGATVEASDLNNAAETTTQFDPNDVQANKAMAILAYIGILVLVPLFASKESNFAKYHTNQGLVLLIAEIAYGIIYGILSSIILLISWRLYFITSIIGIIGIIFLVLSIIGIVNAANGERKPLPVIGGIKILK